MFLIVLRTFQPENISYYDNVIPWRTHVSVYVDVSLETM